MKKEKIDEALRFVTEDAPKHKDIVHGLIGRAVVGLIERNRDISISTLVRELEQRADGKGLEATTAQEALVWISMTQASSDPDH